MFGHKISFLDKTGDICYAPKEDNMILIQEKRAGHMEKVRILETTLLAVLVMFPPLPSPSKDALVSS